MKNNKLKIRWIMDQCYEIAMPNGKHLVIDPGITAPGETEATLSMLQSIERCDYVLITHSHFASTADLRYLCEKFRPFVFIGSLACEQVASYFNLDFSLLHPMHHGQSFDMGDFRFTAYVGKHGGSKHYHDRLAHMNDSTAGPSYSMANVLGNVESFDFCITFANNQRLMFVSGEDDVKNNYAIAAGFCPNVLLRQFLNWPVGRYAQAIEKYHAEVTFAGHHDMVLHGSQEKIQQFYEETSQALTDCGADTLFICPEPCKWYTIGTTVMESSSKE